MLKLGVKQSNLEIRLIGAGNMFLNVVEGSPMDVGKIILHSTMDALYLAGLPLKSQSVGGNFGRSVTFSISSGLINVNLTNGDNVIL
jgi:chemotaxis protein CheD